jgi:hypothetical protein
MRNRYAIPEHSRIRKIKAKSNYNSARVSTPSALLAALSRVTHGAEGRHAPIRFTSRFTSFFLYLSARNSLFRAASQEPS